MILTTQMSDIKLWGSVILKRLWNLIVIHKKENNFRNENK